MKNWLGVERFNKDDFDRLARILIDTTAPGDFIWNNSCLVCGEQTHVFNNIGDFCDEICLKEYKRGLKMITVESSLRAVASKELSKEIIKELRELDPDNAEQVIASVKSMKKKLEEDDAEPPIQEETV